MYYIHTHTHIHTKEYYSAIERNKILPLVTIQMNPKDIMLCEINQTEKTNTVGNHLYVESKEQMNKHNRNRYRGQTGVCQRGGVGGKERTK